MKPFSALLESAAAHGLLLNSFHQYNDKQWAANWRIVDGAKRRFSAAVVGADGFETLSRSLMIAIAELSPQPQGDAFWE